MVAPQNVFSSPDPVPNGNQAEGVIHAVIEKPIANKPSFTDRFADRGFKWLITLSALSVLAIVALFVYELVINSQLSLKQFGWHFFFGSDWDPVSGEFGALPFIFGTLVSSFLALLLAVPLSIGAAIFITEMAPRLGKNAGLVPDGITGGDSKCDLWIVGDFCPSPDFARVR